MKLHPIQEAVLKDLYREGSRVAFRCGNEVGKTSKVATAAILHHVEILGGLVVSTAGVKRQVEHQLWPNLTSYKHLYPGWDFKGLSIKDPKGRERYLGFTAADDGTFQGFHNVDGPLMIVIDEAAAVRDQIIMSAEERCNPTRFLLMGSPLDPVGVFYQACSSLSKFYKQHKLPQTECTIEKGWWLRAEDIARKIEKWGKEHPLVLSNVFGDFALSVQGALLSLREWDAALDSPPQPRGDHRHAFLDFAAGGAENVIAVAQGNRVWIDSAWKERNTITAIGEFVARLNKLRREIGLQPHEVEGDADGMGIVFCQALAEAGWPVQQFHGGAEPTSSYEDYKNRIAEVWTEGTNAIRKREWILPRDEELKAQIISRRSGRDEKGRLTIESKKDMAKRGLDSPDRGDAVLGAMSPLPLGKSHNIAGTREFAESWLERMDHNYEGDSGVKMPGDAC